jgi:hypothetical protein
MSNLAFHMPRLQASVPARPTSGKTTRKNFLARIPCNPLISLDSGEEIQGNPTLISGGFRSERPGTKNTQIDEMSLRQRMDAGPGSLQT